MNRLKYHTRALQALGIIVSMATIVMSWSPVIAAEGTEQVPVRIAATVDAISVPQWIAQERGIFEKYGLKATESVFNVNYQGLVAVGAGSVDVSIQAGPPTISYLSKGLKAKAIAVVGRFPQGYKLVANQNIEQLSDLKGKRVAWPSGTGAEYALSAIAEEKGLALSAFEHVDIPPAEAVPLFLRNKVDGIFYWEPWPRRALKNGGEQVHVVVTNEGIYESNMFLTVGDAFAARHAGAVKSILRVFKDAQDVLKEQPELGVELLQTRMRVDAETARDAMSDYEYTVTLDRQTAQAALGVADWLLKSGKIETKPSWPDVFAAEYLGGVYPRAVRDFPW